MIHRILFLFALGSVITSAETRSGVNLPLSDSLNYRILNSVVLDLKIKRLHAKPMRYIFNSYISTDSNGNVTDSGANAYLNRVFESDSGKLYLNRSDFEFMKWQTEHPSIKKFEKENLKNCVLQREQTLIPQCSAITVPLISKDGRFAVVSVNFYGMSRTYLYKQGADAKTWERVDQLWQSGT